MSKSWTSLVTRQVLCLIVHMGKPNISREIVAHIISLRKVGYSINEIKREVSASKSTISRYVTGVDVPSPYKEALHAKRGWSTVRMQIAETEASRKAKELVPCLTRKELLLCVASLYWAEGAKRDFSFTNSDPSLIQVFVKGLQEVFSVPLSDIQVGIRTYEDLERETCKRFWASITGVLPEQIISVDVLQGRKKGKLKYGMCRIRIKRGGSLLKLMKSLREEIINNHALVSLQDTADLRSSHQRAGSQ